MRNIVLKLMVAVGFENLLFCHCHWVVVAQNLHFHIIQYPFCVFCQMFLVAEFTSTRDVAVIPSNWVVDDAAQWPPYQSSTKIDKAVRTRETPGDDWPRYSMKVHYSTGSILKEILFAKYWDSFSVREISLVFLKLLCI